MAPHIPRTWTLFLVLSMASAIVGCHSNGPADHPGATAAETRARNAERLVEHGRAYAEAGDSLRAQQYFASALKSGADENVVLPLLLRACVEERNYRFAAEVAEAALARRPADAHLRFLAGAIYGSLGDAAHARAHLERAARELPEEADVQFSVGVFFRDEAADVPTADGYFRRYLALAPRGAHADEARGSLMARLEHASDPTPPAASPEEVTQ